MVIVFDVKKIKPIVLAVECKLKKGYPKKFECIGTHCEGYDLQLNQSSKWECIFYLYMPL